MNNDEQPNPRQELEDLIAQQGGNSLENCNLEFLGYQQGLTGELPRSRFGSSWGVQKRLYLGFKTSESTRISGNRKHPPSTPEKKQSC